MLRALLLATLCLTACATPDGPPSDETRLRVISYNVLVGFQDYRVGDPYHPGAVRKRNVTAFLAAQQPDVVALQEMNGYTTARLRAEARAWGHPHVVMLKERGYPTALTSRWPIEVVERQLEGMHHGLMRVRTGGVDYVVVHLWPFQGDARLREVRAALAMYARAREDGQPCLVLGDFNAIAPDDISRFDAAARARFAKWRWETDPAGQPRTDVMRACFAAGLVDVCARTGGLPARMQVPRVDYVLAGPALAARSLRGRWLPDPERLRDSDHPVVVCDFR